MLHGNKNRDFFHVEKVEFVHGLKIFLSLWLIFGVLWWRLDRNLWKREMNRTIYILKSREFFLMNVNVR